LANDGLVGLMPAAVNVSQVKLSTEDNAESFAALRGKLLSPLGILQQTTASGG